MRLGLVTDIHSHPVELGRALSLFRQHRVDRVVTIGDTIDAFARSDGAGEVASLLLEADATGVWGNHDFSLRGDVAARARSRFPEVVFEFMARTQSRLVLGDCHFSHREASVDANDAAALWELSDQPLDMVERARRCFQTASPRWQFIGHYHRWWAATPARGVVWEGGEPLVFDRSERYFVIVGPTCEGWCGILDLERARLEPHWCGAEYEKSNA